MKYLIPACNDESGDVETFLFLDLSREKLVELNERLVEFHTQPFSYVEKWVTHPLPNTTVVSLDSQEFVHSLPVDIVPDGNLDAWDPQRYEVYTLPDDFECPLEMTAYNQADEIWISDLVEFVVVDDTCRTLVFPLFHRSRIEELLEEIS